MFWEVLITMRVKCQILKNRLLLFLFMILYFNFLFPSSLNEIKGLKKLSNYNEIKNIEVERIVDWNDIDRNKKFDKVFVHGENDPFTGAAVLKKNQKILGILFYNKGQTVNNLYEYYENGQLKLQAPYILDKLEGNGTEYFQNGRLKDKIIYKNGVVVDSTEYNQNGNLFRIFKSTSKDGLRGIIDGTNKQGYRSVTEVIQDYSIKNRVEYIWDGYAKVYDKSGKMIADMNFKQNKMMGLPQKLYKNGKLKYYMVAASNDPDNFDVQDFYKEYYDNSEQIRIDCEEVSKGEWSCKEYAKNGSLKREFQSPKYKLKEDTSLGWNMVLGILNILLYTH